VERGERDWKTIVLYLDIGPLESLFLDQRCKKKKSLFTNSLCLNADGPYAGGLDKNEDSWELAVLGHLNRRELPAR